MLRASFLIERTITLNLLRDYEKLSLSSYTKIYLLVSFNLGIYVTENWRPKFWLFFEKRSVRFVNDVKILKTKHSFLKTIVFENSFLKGMKLSYASFKKKIRTIVFQTIFSENDSFQNNRFQKWENDRFEM